MVVVLALGLGGCFQSYTRRAHDDASTDAVMDPDLDFNIDPGDEALRECHDRLFDVSTGYPDVLILMDRSNSMTDGGFWSPARRAVEEITAQWEDQIAFGFAIFPTSLCSMGSFMCIPTTSVDVHPALGTSTAIEDRLGESCCCGGTPLAGSLEFVGRYFQGLDDGRAHHVLLVTDGAPNCNPELDRFTCTCTWDGCATLDTDSLNCLDDSRTIAAATGLYADGVPVHVLGMADAAITWSLVMDSIAEAGGTDEALLAEERGQVQDALASIAGSVAPCRFELLPGEVGDPEQLTFFVDGDPVQRDPTHENGWDWVNEWTVDFFGPACQSIVEGDVATVTARVNCAS